MEAKAGLKILGKAFHFKLLCRLYVISTKDYTVKHLHNEVLRTSKILCYAGYSVVKVMHHATHNRAGYKHVQQKKTFIYMNKREIW